MPLRAVTFDFWNTVMAEPPGGLAGARTAQWARLLARVGQPRSPADLAAAHDAATEQQQAAWRRNEQYVTTDAAAAMAGWLDLDLDGDAFRAFDRVFATAARSAGVRPCTGIEELLGELRSAGLGLAIICDIGLTPAEGVRALLGDAGLLECFDTTVFSDEQGVYKPDARIFRHTLAVLDADPGSAVHVGDRRRTDVEGALGCGMGAVRYRAVFDDLDDRYRDAPVVVDTHAQLSELLRAGRAVA